MHIYKETVQIIKKNITSFKDKIFIVCDIKNTNPLKAFNNYFNHLYLLGNNVGFCCGLFFPIIK